MAIKGHLVTNDQKDTTGVNIFKSNVKIRASPIRSTNLKSGFQSDHIFSARVRSDQQKLLGANIPSDQQNLLGCPSLLKRGSLKFENSQLREKCVFRNLWIPIGTLTNQIDEINLHDIRFFSVSNY
jgi:hypothetical protein